MQSVLDNYLGIHTQALALEAQRTDVLAANLANVDTPNYKARDIDFQAAMAAAASAAGGGDGTGSMGDGTGTGSGLAMPLPLATPDAASSGLAAPLALAAPGSVDLTADAAVATDAAAGTGATGATDASGYLKYRVPLAPSLDGNTVDEQLEESAFAQNSVRYQATLTFLNVKLHDLLTAIGS